MADVVLVYPYFYDRARDTSIFKFPPLGLGYLASALAAKGVSVEVVEGTFSSPAAIIERVQRAGPAIVGVYVMVTLEHEAVDLARRLRAPTRLLVAGGPYPSADAELFLPAFDVVAVGEGERSVVELAAAHLAGGDISAIPGLAHLDGGRIVRTPTRGREDDLDAIPLPARESFDNAGYQKYWREHYGYAMTSMITTRGCPFSCGFCSKPVFGDVYRERSAASVADELEEIQALGYDAVWMADDCFTLNDRRVLAICDEIDRRGLCLKWECLSRVDGVRLDVLERMREAGCSRVFFGLESGNDRMLSVMKKQTTTAAERSAVELTKRAGLAAGGFFILGYPGETNATLLDTVNFSSGLGLDYLSYTVPYPLPGTDLYELVKDRINGRPWTSPRRHKLLYKSDLSIIKLKFAMGKGLIQQHLARRDSGRRLEPLFRKSTDLALRLIP